MGQDKRCNTLQQHSKTYRALVPDHVVVVALAEALALGHVGLEQLERTVLGRQLELIMPWAIEQHTSPVLVLHAPPQLVRAASDVVRTDSRRKREYEPEEGSNPVLHVAPMMRGEVQYGLVRCWCCA